MFNWFLIKEKEEEKKKEKRKKKKEKKKRMEPIKCPSLSYSLTLAISKNPTLFPGLFFFSSGIELETLF